MKEDYLTKSLARQVLIRNFGSLEKAKVKLGDTFLLTSFAGVNAPLTKKTIFYLENLDYHVGLLYNTCQECGVSYSYSNIATDKLCMLCANRNRYLRYMVTEPSNVREYLHNLDVLSKFFDTKDDAYYTDLIESVVICFKVKDYERPKELGIYAGTP